MKVTLKNMEPTTIPKDASSSPTLAPTTIAAEERSSGLVNDTDNEEKAKSSPMKGNQPNSQSLLATSEVSTTKQGSPIKTVVPPEQSSVLKETKLNDTNKHDVKTLSKSATSSSTSTTPDIPVNVTNKSIPTTTTTLPDQGGNQIPSTNSSNNSTRKINPVLMADPQVVQMTHDILGLLQTYGPLTRDQMEYNLPPCNRPSLLNDILELLVATGVVHVVKPSNIEDDHHSQDPTSGLSDDPKNRLYVVLASTPQRHDVILPHQVMSVLEGALQECQASLQRAEWLREALLKSATEDGSSPQPDIFLSLQNKIRTAYPDLEFQDPVYRAAWAHTFNPRTTEEQSKPSGIP
jgi:hypothetical protein